MDADPAKIILSPVDADPVMITFTSGCSSSFTSGCRSSDDYFHQWMDAVLVMIIFTSGCSSSDDYLHHAVDADLMMITFISGCRSNDDYFHQWMQI